MVVDLRLPRPALASVVDDTPVVRTTVDPRVMRGHLPDPQVLPRSWAVTWQAVDGAKADAIRRAYEDAPYATFRLELPQFGEVVVVWRTPPSTQWSSWSHAATVTAEIEEATAYE